MKILEEQKNGNNVEWIAKEGRKFVQIEKKSLGIIVKVPKSDYFKLIKDSDLETLFCDYSDSKI